MAEFLVYNKTHWMDNLTQTEIDARNLQAKYDRRYQKGDIIEVREDGYWTDGARKGFGVPEFALVIVPNLSLSDSQKYMGEDMDNTDMNNRITKKRRKYKIDLTKVVLDADSKATLSGVIDSNLVDKTK